MYGFPSVLQDHRRLSDPQAYFFRPGQHLAAMPVKAAPRQQLEGQFRSISDFELVALAEVLGVSINWLVGLEDKAD